ncbi:unnamed protein product [Paramecium pentaurelia]|uniref:Uncharacterized protein n=1 Tax=Paramecium pentaurelia TaxID=43138 RepID=A0A8S1TFV4_9CILI|nr:unnamed protein product [Paramecium pentaurelia]
MKIFWLRPCAGDSLQSTMVYQKQKQKTIKQISTPQRESTKFPSHLSFEKAKTIIENVNNKILSDQVRTLLNTPVKNWMQLHNNLNNLEKCYDFFNIKVNSLFQQLVDQIFKKQNENYQIKTLIITLDYYMNIQTFLLFLYWRLLRNSEDLVLIEKTLYQIIKIKYICLNVDFLMEHFIHFLFDNRIKLRQVKPYEIIPNPLIGHEEMDLFQIDPTVLSNAITEINEEFYSFLQFDNLLTNLDNGKQSQFLSEYFDRINSFSLYIQASILQKKDRKKAIDYFYEVCLELCKNEDGEGVFLLFTLSIERLDQDLLHTIQYISPIQQQILIDMTKTFVCNKHIYTPTNTKKLYPIPSFYHFWTHLKKLEQAAQQSKNLKYIDQIRIMLLDLMFIRQSNYSRLLYRKIQSDPLLKYFLLKGHQTELSQILEIPIGNWNQMQLKLMKMASI